MPGSLASAVSSSIRWNCTFGTNSRRPILSSECPHVVQLRTMRSYLSREGAPPPYGGDETFSLVMSAAIVGLTAGRLWPSSRHDTLKITSLRIVSLFELPLSPCQCYSNISSASRLIPIIFQEFAFFWASQLPRLGHPLGSLKVRYHFGRFFPFSASRRSISP